MCDKCGHRALGIGRMASRLFSTAAFVRAALCRTIGRPSSTTGGALHGCTKEGAILSNGWIHCKAKHDCDALGSTNTSLSSGGCRFRVFRSWFSDSFQTLDSSLQLSMVRHFFSTTPMKLFNTTISGMIGRPFSTTRGACVYLRTTCKLN